MAFEPGAQIFDEIAPHPDGVDPDDELVHERVYVVRAYRKSADTLVLRGSVRDQKPPGLFVPTDPAPFTMHHMIVDLEIRVPTLVIISATAVLEVHPHSGCPRIEGHYGNLVGLSIARGFTHKVRELFGGPRGCTHTTALLQAMAPVAVQSLWSFRAAQMRGDRDDDRDDHKGGEPSPSGVTMPLEQALFRNLNSCHVWAEDGDLVASLRNNVPMEVPVTIVRRMEELGLDPATLRNGG